jgi:hypothetical protein
VPPVLDDGAADADAIPDGVRADLQEVAAEDVAEAIEHEPAEPREEPGHVAGGHAERARQHARRHSRGTPEELATQLRADLARWTRVARAAGWASWLSVIPMLTRFREFLRPRS